MPRQVESLSGKTRSGSAAADDSFGCTHVFFNVLYLFWSPSESLDGIPFLVKSLEEDKFKHLFGQGPFGEWDCPLCGFMSSLEAQRVQNGRRGGDK